MGLGVFASQPISESEILAVWGGQVITTEERSRLPESVERYAIQIERDLHLTCNADEVGLAEYFNHSCAPNAGLQGQIVLVAMRAIPAGEQVCFDYAMSEADPDFSMECACGQPACRHRITGRDWQIPELQTRYRGYFSSYIQRMIQSRK